MLVLLSSKTTLFHCVYIAEPSLPFGDSSEGKSHIIGYIIAKQGEGSFIGLIEQQYCGLITLAAL